MRVLAAASACLALLAPLAAAGPAAAKAPRTEREWIRQTLARMTLKEKVGQLFVINGFGTGLHDRSPEAVKFNRKFYGVSTSPS